jgi:triacylglycerol esterase/lipase EstA (alpha/beta hydrolase family)
MLHGYMMSRASFLLLARRLQRAGLGPVYGFEYWTMGTVNSAAERLGEFVASVCAETGASSVDLIGHSMGGVVARYFATLAGGAERVENLITIGSPHGGAHVSSLGIGRPQRELRPGSPLMQRLEVADIPEGVRPLVIWSRADALVWNRAQAGWRGAEELVFDDLGHVALLYSRRVAREIIARLRDRRA